MFSKILKIVAKILGGLVGGIAGVFLLILLFLSVAKFFVYSDYFRIWSRESTNPGLNKGYVPQGCTFNDDENCYITVGYMADGSASRIYKIDKKNRKTSFYTLKSQNQDFFGHTGGIQYAKGYLYLANESDGVYKFPASFLGTEKSVEIGSPIHVNNNSSFVFSDDVYLYVGEFNDDKNYISSNEITYNGKTQRAIVTKYALDNLSVPVEIYSIPNQIQGFAVTDSGKIVLSRSWAVSSSNFYIFDSNGILDTGTKIDGAKVYYLDKDNVQKNLIVPPMSEDLDYKDGKILYFSETACNKYIFGKFFLDYFIYGLKID